MASQEKTSFIELAIILSTIFSVFIILKTVSDGATYIIREPIQSYKMGHGDLYFIDKPPLEVRFSELLHAYDYEADTANNIYAGRHIKMECVIKEVIGNNGRTYINIGDLDSWTSQTAAIELMEFSKDLFRLNRGDRITIGGILSGGRSFTDIRLSNVYIIVMQRASEKTNTG